MSLASFPAPHLPLLQAPRGPCPSPLRRPNPTSPRSGKPAFGKGWLALLGWPPWLRTSALRSCARSWTTCGLTLITWGCSSRTGESVGGEGRGGERARSGTLTTLTPQGSPQHFALGRGAREAAAAGGPRRLLPLQRHGQRHGERLLPRPRFLAEEGRGERA